jgi:CheY-like chemotaxis protein
MSAAPILLVEDDPDIQENLRFLLNLEGYQVQSANNGKESLAYLQAANPASVILLDLMMPVMDGYEFLENFYAEDSPTLAHEIPVVVLSAARDFEGVPRERGIAFVKKPIDIDHLLDVIRTRCLAQARDEKIQ